MFLASSCTIVVIFSSPDHLPFNLSCVFQHERLKSNWSGEENSTTNPYPNVTFTFKTERQYLFLFIDIIDIPITGNNSYFSWRLQQFWQLYTRNKEVWLEIQSIILLFQHLFKLVYFYEEAVGLKNTFLRNG